MTSAYVQHFYAPHDMKATRIVAAGEVTRCSLFETNFYGDSDLLGRHEGGREFDPPIAIRAGTALILMVEPASAVDGWLGLDEVHDAAWHARVEREALARRAAAQDAALDDALWRSGVPT